MGGSRKRCEVCKEAESKYKCPSCYAPYCSLPCFKKHKETPCEKPVPSEEKTCTPLLPEKVFQVDDPGHLLQKTQLEAIVSSDDVRDALKDKDLQTLISKINSSQNGESELDKAMELEGFRVFTEKVLLSMNP